MTKNIFYGAREKNLASAPMEDEKSAKHVRAPAKGRKPGKAKSVSQQPTARRADQHRDVVAKRDARADAVRANAVKRDAAERAQNEVASR